MRRAFAFLLVGVAVLLAAAPAFAHEEINPANIVTGKPVFFILSAADETAADMNKVILAAPSGVHFGATTKDPAGWAVQRTEQVITWTGGAVKPDRFEQWGFEIEGADQPGTLSYRVTFGFADGKTEDVTVDVKAAADNAAGPATNSGTPSGRADATLALALVALVLAVLGVVRGNRRRPGDPVASAPAAEVQDW